MKPRRPPPPDFPFWIELPLRHPWFLGLVGLAVAAAMVPLSLGALEDFRSSPDSPASMSLAEAAAIADTGADVSVTLTDVSWSCDETIQDGKVAIQTSPDGRRFLAELGSSQPCVDAGRGPTTGVLRLLRPKRREWLEANAGLKLNPSDEPALLLCTYCGRDNAMLGLILGPTLFVLGLAMYPIGRMARKHHYGY